MCITDGILGPLASEYEVSLPDIFCYNTSAGRQCTTALDATKIEALWKTFPCRSNG